MDAKPTNDPNEITRIDLFENPGGTQVFKFAAGWRDGTRPYPVEVKLETEWTLEKMDAWLVDHGWKARHWPGGARYWNGEITPIRTRSEIMAKRAKLERTRSTNDPRLQIHALDLAYDL